MIAIPLIWGVCVRDIEIGTFGILFTLGAWQTISFIIHLAMQRRPWMASGRKAYGYTFLIVATLGLGSLVMQDLIFVFLMAMLFVGPVMGIIYLVISRTEWLKAKAMMRRGRQGL